MTALNNAAAIVLAAGRSQRFGTENKLLHPIDGVPMVRHTVQHVLDAGLGQVVVVTGHDADEVERALQGLCVKCVRNATPWAGMGTSLAVGANAVGDDTEAVMIMLGDMPTLKTETLVAILDVFDPTSGHDIVIPFYDGRRGHPVTFGARHLPRLRAQTGDQGAKDLLRDAPERVQAIEVDDPGILMDVDTPGDLPTL